MNKAHEDAKAAASENLSEKKGRKLIYAGKRYPEKEKEGGSPN